MWLVCFAVIRVTYLGRVSSAKKVHFMIGAPHFGLQRYVMFQGRLHVKQNLKTFPGLVYPRFGPGYGDPFLRLVKHTAATPRVNRQTDPKHVLQIRSL